MHPSTVSRAVSSKYAHTPQGVFELRYFFSEAVQGPRRRRHAAADPEAQGQEDDRRGGSRASTDRRTDHRAPAGRRNRGDPPHGRQVSRRYADSVHASAARSQLDGDLRIMKVSYTRGSRMVFQPSCRRSWTPSSPNCRSCWTGAGKSEAHVVVTRSGICTRPRSPCSFTITSWWATAPMPTCSRRMSAALESWKSRPLKQRAKWRETTRRSDSIKVVSAKEDQTSAAEPRAKRKKSGTGNGQVRRNAASPTQRVFRVNDHETSQAHDARRGAARDGRRTAITWSIAMPTSKRSPCWSGGATAISI